MTDQNAPGRNLRTAAACVVVFVAAAAAVQSFSHIYDLGHVHGQSALNSALLAMSVDGLILAMSLVILHEARAGRRAPVLAYLMLWLGVAATVAANVIYGLPFGPVGAVSSAWPALAFIGSVHVVMHVARTWRESRGTETRKPMSAAVAGSAEEAAALAYAASVAATNPLSERALADRFGIPRSQARKIRARQPLSAAGAVSSADLSRPLANGSGPGA